MIHHNQILLYTPSDAGFEWISGVVSASAGTWSLVRARDRGELAAESSKSALVIVEEGEDEWSAPSWSSVSSQLESLGAPRILYLSVFDFSSKAREAGFTRRIHLQRKPCSAKELLDRIEDLAAAGRGVAS